MGLRFVFLLGWFSVGFCLVSIAYVFFVLGVGSGVGGVLDGLSLGGVEEYYVSFCCGSMSPTINVGDRVFFVNFTNQSLREGDIVIYRDPLNVSRRITHRIVKIVGEGSGALFVVKGDNNLVADPVVLNVSDIERLVTKVEFG